MAERIAARRARRRAGAAEARLLPMINVVLLLLTVFMVTGRLSAADPFPIDPPRSSTEEGGEPRGTVFIRADGALSFDGREGDAPSIAAAIAAREDADPLRIKADAAAPAAALTALLAALDVAGARDARLVVARAGR